CVSELTGYLNASQSTVSHQLNILKAHKLIRRRREGKQIYYSVSDCHVSLVTKLGIEIVTARK
ncbi:ArsR/SmtB family transcription factor, partial [Lachnospiraceae bacterium SGI.054]